MAEYFPPPSDNIEEEDVLLMDEYLSLPRPYGSVPKAKNYWEVILGEFSDSDFRSCLRLSRNCFYKFVNFLVDKIETCEHGKQQTPIIYQAIIFLHYLGTEESLTQISKRYGLSKSGIQIIVNRVLDAVVPSLSEAEIKWPDEGQTHRTTSKFRDISGFPNVVGAIDCRENPILAPIESPDSYYNRNRYHSVKLQAVVDSDYVFIDIFIGWPGKSHDARCFANSPLEEKLESGRLDLGEKVILGDSAYPLRGYLMTPFKMAPPNTYKSRYNTALSKARQVSFLCLQ